MSTFLDQFLDILKVPSHPHFEMLLGIADVNLVGHLTGDPVDDNRHPAVAAVLTFARFSTASTVAISHLEVHRFDAVGKLLGEIAGE